MQGIGYCCLTCRAEIDVEWPGLTQPLPDKHEWNADQRLDTPEIDAHLPPPLANPMQDAALQQRGG